jgi:hypothetical protein
MSLQGIAERQEQTPDILVFKLSEQLRDPVAERVPVAVSSQQG